MCDPVSATIGAVGGLMMTMAQPRVPKAPAVPEVAAVAKDPKKADAKTSNSSDYKRGLSSTLLTGSRGLQTKALTKQNTMLGGNTKLGQ